MTTSGVYTQIVTRDDIVRQALLNIRRLDPDDSPLPSETKDCVRTLNFMVAQWQGKSDFAPGLKVWTRNHVHLLLNGAGYSYILGGPYSQGWTTDLVTMTLTVGGSLGDTTLTVNDATGVGISYRIAIQLDSGVLFYTTTISAVGTSIGITAPLPSSAASGNSVYSYLAEAQLPLNVETAVLRDADNSDSPIKIMTVQSYDYLPNKTDPKYRGDPAAIYFETKLGYSQLFTDVGQAQDVSKHLVLTCMFPVQKFVNPLDEPFYPEEWFLALSWGLAEQIAPMFHAVWTPQMENLKNNAMSIARNKGAEISELFFQPGADE